MFDVSYVGGGLRLSVEDGSYLLSRRDEACLTCGGEWLRVPSTICVPFSIDCPAAKNKSFGRRPVVGVVLEPVAIDVPGVANRSSVDKRSVAALNFEVCMQSFVRLSTCDGFSFSPTELGCDAWLGRLAVWVAGLLALILHVMTRVLYCGFVYFRIVEE